jgi:hypothetical protein
MSTQLRYSTRETGCEVERVLDASFIVFQGAQLAARRRYIGAALHALRHGDTSAFQDGAELTQVLWFRSAKAASPNAAPITGFHGMRLTWHGQPLHKEANWRARIASSLTPPSTTYSQVTRRPVCAT